jgi:DNA polymerase
MKDDELAALERRVRDAGLPLSDGSTLVFGEGCADADVFVVGEAPGAKEDELGEPFVGRSGTVLREALSNAGLGDDDVYISNVVKYRPPENRDPRVDEIREHAPYLLEEISIVDPEVVLVLGNTAAEFFFGEDEVFSGISRERGESFTVSISGEEYVVFPSYHPAATLYDGSLREVFVEDLRRVAQQVLSS